MDVLPVIGQSASFVHSTHLPARQVKPVPSTLQLSSEMPSDGVHICEHLPLSHENFEPSHTHCAWYVWQSIVNPASHSWASVGQLEGGVGQQSFASWQEMSTHCLPVGCRFKLPTEQVFRTHTSPALQSTVARHDSPRPLSLDGVSVVDLSELHAPKSETPMDRTITVRNA
jgi:hypothetical protein